MRREEERQGTRARVRLLEMKSRSDVTAWQGTRARVRLLEMKYRSDVTARQGTRARVRLLGWEDPQRK